MRGRPDGTPGKTLSQTDMNTKIDELFATLRVLISDQSRDLAMAMAELRSVAKERDRLRIERDEAGVRADFAGLAFGRRGAELEKLTILHRDAVAGWNKAALERDSTRQSLREAQQDVAETDGINSDLRTVNARLVADLAAAMQRADTAEAILRAKA